MNSTELASLLFPFDPETDRIIFYGITIAYSVTALYNVLLISCRMLKRCVPKRTEVPFAKLTSVCVESPQRGHEIIVEATPRSHE